MSEPLSFASIMRRAAELGYTFPRLDLIASTLGYVKFRDLMPHTELYPRIMRALEIPS